jgi:hypothetical protein
MTPSIRISVGTAAGIVAALTVWCIINSWDSGDDDSEDELLLVDED